MSLSDSFENALLLLWLNNTNIANIGDATGIRGSSSAGVVYVALHSSDPGEAANASSGQATNELSYTGYARVSVARTSAGWTVSGSTASNAAQVDFPQCTGGSVTATYFSVGTSLNGSGYLIGSGVLTSPLAISNGITPGYAPGQLTWTVD